MPPNDGLESHSTLQLDDLRSPSAEEDARWIAAIVAGAEAQAAYTALVEKYWKVVIGWVRPQAPALDDAEEIAQDVFIKAFRSLAGLEAPCCFLAWLLRIASNAACDALRRRRRDRSIEGLIARNQTFHASAASDPAVGLEEAEGIDRLLAVVAELPEKYRMVLTLRYQIGLSPKEIAEQLSEPEGTIRNRLFRALEKVKRALATDRQPGRDEIERPHGRRGPTGTWRPTAP